MIEKCLSQSLQRKVREHCRIKGLNPLFFLVLIFVVSIWDVSVTPGQISYSQLINGGVALKNAGDLDGAIAAYSSAIQLDPSAPFAYYNRAIVKRAKQDFAGALNDYIRTLEVDPKNVAAYCNRGILRNEMGDLPRATSDLESAIKIDPTDGCAYQARGVMRSAANDLDNAIKDFGIALKLLKEPDAMASTFNNRGWAKFLKKENKGAIEDFSAAISVDPLYKEAYNNRGLANSREGHVVEALADYGKSIELDKKNANGYFNRGVLLANMRDFGGSLTDLNVSVQLMPKDAASYFYRGLARSNLGDPDGAITDFSTALALSPEYSGVFTLRGYAYGKQGKYSEAMADYEKALRANPNNAEALRYRAWTKLFMNDGRGAYDDAIVSLQHANPKFPSTGYAIIIGFIGLRKSGSQSSAETFLKTWLKQVPPDNWTTKILCFFDGQLSEERLLTFATVKTAQTEAHTYIAEIKEFSGDHAAALKHFQWVKTEGEKNMTEFTLAIKEIERLQPL